MYSREENVAEKLQEAGIRPSAQRISVGCYVLFTEEHPSAEQVLAEVERLVPMISRATVYNTLNLFVQRGLLQELVIEEGHVVFDPRLDSHHHFLDTSTGKISDLPADAFMVSEQAGLEGVEIEDVQVVVRGRRHAITSN